MESPLGKLLQRIVHFLGTLGGQSNTCLVTSESAAAYAARAVAWDSKKRLEFALPFQDMKPSIYLGTHIYLHCLSQQRVSMQAVCLPTDPFLPRVCELAVSSSDRQSKVAACELLHAMVLFMIGKSAQPLHARMVGINKRCMLCSFLVLFVSLLWCGLFTLFLLQNPMTKLYKKVLPYLLQLACDVERVGWT